MGGPQLRRKVSRCFAASFLTGGVGGLIYGSIRTDVYGDIKLTINVIDIGSDKSIIEKEYVGHYTERKAMMNSDSAKTRATMVGNSLKMVMDEFKEDLTKALGRESGIEHK